MNFLIIRGVPPAERQAHLKLENIRAESCDQCQRHSRIFIYALLALTNCWNDFPEILNFVNNVGRSSNITPTWKFLKIKDLIISETRDQCQRYSGTITYALLAFTIPYSNFPEIHHFIDNLGCSHDITPT